jgi:C1A family cysteine protease
MAQTGVMVRPNIMAEQLLGGHDVTVVGYDTNFLNNPDFLKSGIDPAKVNNTALIIRNSWGVQWGIQGYFYMPVDYASSTQTGGDAYTGRI